MKLYRLLSLHDVGAFECYKMRASVRRYGYASPNVFKSVPCCFCFCKGVEGVSPRKTTPLVMTALGVCLNVIGSSLAMVAHLPIYLDTLGTIFVSLSCGPVYGVSCALASSIFNSTYDPFALPFIPAGLTAALFASLLRQPRFDHWPLVLKAFVVSFPTSIVSASIAAYIFGGITSAGSSYIVQFLYGAMHLPLVASTFIVQVGTDYLDKLIIMVVVSVLLVRMPQRIKDKI